MQYSALTMALASSATAQIYASLTAAPVAPSAPVYGAPPVISPSLVPAPVIPFPSSNLTALPIFPSGNNGTGAPIPLPVQTSDLTTYTTVCPITTCYTNGGIPTTTVITITSTITTCVKCIGVPGATPPAGAQPLPTAPGGGSPPTYGGSAAPPNGGGALPSNGGGASPPLYGGSQGAPVAPGATASNAVVPKVSGTNPVSQFTGAAMALKPAGALVAGAAAAVALL